jgi:hypothetical protein
VVIRLDTKINELDAVSYEGVGIFVVNEGPFDFDKVRAEALRPGPPPGIVDVTYTSVQGRRLAVDTVTATPSGFAVDFNRAIDPDVLNLYDVESGTLGPADVTLVGDATGPVPGSLVVAEERLTFIATRGVLVPDNYTVTLRSADDAIRDENGELLDGNNDGSPGGDYMTPLTIAAPQDVVVSLPDFTRGPGQPIDLPATQTGLPLMLDDNRTAGDGINLVHLTITYDPALLSITAADPGPDAPKGAAVSADTSTPGRIVVSFITSTTPLANGASHFVTLTATVPGDAAYGAAHVLDVSGVTINEGGISATADDAIHLAGFPGDATGNRSYSGLDAQRVARIDVGLDQGFAAYPCLDPVVVADVTGYGSLSGLNARRIAQQTVGSDASEIPPIPQALRLDRLPAGAGELSPLTDSQLNSAVEAVVARIGAVENDEATRLRDVTFEIVDLPGDLLGMTCGRAIQIDVDAAGYGWFVDSTPWDNVEFAQANGTHDLTALPGSSAADRADLLTVIMHELGHVFGHDHSDGGVMEDSLPLGTRRVWDDASLLDVVSDASDVLDGPGLTAPAVDGYFAKT